MFPEIFRTVYKHAQTFGKENTLSALLASMFEFSPNLLLYMIENLGLSITVGQKLLPVSDVFRIETGPTYFCTDHISSENYTFRPDIVAYAGNSFNSREVNDFIVFESKIDSQITPRQLLGYPFLKQQFGKDALLVLVTNSANSDAVQLFDCCVSWQNIIRIIQRYVDESCGNLAESHVTKDLLDTMETIGIDFKQLTLEEIKPSQSVIKNLAINEFVKLMRKKTGLTQIEFAKSAGVGLRFLRDLEQGKATVRIDKVNDVLHCFGCQIGPIKKQNNTDNI